MSSSVFFRFKSQKEPSRVAFDGTGISVFELKREIISLNRLGDGTDFELVISSEDTNEEYDDDTSIIPRSTTVIAKRLPALKPGRGGAARYVSGKMPLNAKNSHRAEPSTSKVASKGKGFNAVPVQPDLSSAQTEDQRMEAILKMGADQWKQQAQEMANATPIHRGGPNKGRPANVSDRPPPSSYVCYRCGEKGHYIQACPTNDDPAFDNHIRVKRTTGIPRSFLKTIEKPTALSNDGTLDNAKHPAGVMVNAEGEWVIAEPDKASWEQYQAKAKLSAAAQEAAALGSKELQKRGLECSIDKRLFVEPTKTPCCGTTYCHDCINNALLENDLSCPHCSKENILIDDLIPDNETVAKIQAYEDEKAAAARGKEASKSPAQTVALPAVSKKPASPKDANSPPSKPSTGLTAPSTTNITNSPKKRPAENDLKNDRIPPGPPVEAAKQPTNVTKPESSGQRVGATLNGSNAQQFPFMNGNLIPSQGMNAMAFPNQGGLLDFPMGMAALPMDAGMWTAMMTQGGAFMGDGSWNTSWGPAYPQQAQNLPQFRFQNGMMPNGNFSQPNSYAPMGNGFMGNGLNTQGMGAFTNQQRNTFSAPALNEEDSAYFRKPVNPHRHQARRNLNRPTDYREI